MSAPPITVRDGKPASFIVGLALVAAAGAGTAGQRQDAGWIGVRHVDGAAGQIKAREEPYVDGAPRVAFQVEPVEGVEAKDGRLVTTLEFLAWVEGDGARVLAYGLPDQRSRDARTYLGSVFVEWNSYTTFEMLRELGIEGVRVWAGSAPQSSEANQSLRWPASGELLG